MFKKVWERYKREEVKQEGARERERKSEREKRREGVTERGQKEG